VGLFSIGGVELERGLRYADGKLRDVFRLKRFAFDIQPAGAGVPNRAAEITAGACDTEQTTFGFGEGEHHALLCVFATNDHCNPCS
jgi:hypothetical protein